MAWQRFEAAGGLIGVWLPPGEELRDLGGVTTWSPDPQLGNFSVVTGDGDLGDGDTLLANERAHGELDLESDEREERGGLPARHLRYRVRRSVPHAMVRTNTGGTAHAGGGSEEHANDFFLLESGGRLVRAGYVVRTDAPDELRATLAEILDRMEVDAR